MTRDLRIVFMGTPSFAVPCLRILVEAGYSVVGVITATDKYGGRGKKTLIQSPIKAYALEKNIKVLQPKNLKSKSFVSELSSLEADLQIVVAFRMLPVVVWDMPRLGTYNIHGSLLPAYRGAAPINWAIINGERKTGVTSFKLKHEIDTGDTLFQKTMPIYHFDSVKQVHDRMSILAADAVLETVDALQESNIKLIHQDDSLVSHAPKLFTETCVIDPHQSILHNHNFIRGLNPFPTAWTTLDDKKLKVFNTSSVEADDDISIGTWISDNKTYLKLRCKDGYLNLLDLQLQGKRRMSAKEFLNGYKVMT